MTTEEQDFDGCSRACRNKGKHVLDYGRCAYADKPEPTVSMSKVYTAADGHLSIGYDQYTVQQLAEPETEVQCEGCGHHEGEGCGCPSPTRGIRGLLEHVGIDTTGKDIRVGDRVVDAWPHSCDYRAMRCNLARTRQEHTQHDWEPQPGMTPLHCSGHPEGGENQ